MPDSMTYDLIILNLSADFTSKALKRVSHKRTTCVAVADDDAYWKNLPKAIKAFYRRCDFIDRRRAIYNGLKAVNGLVLAFGHANPFTNQVIYFGPNALHEYSWITTVGALSCLCVNYKSTQIRKACADVNYDLAMDEVLCLK